MTTLTQYASVVARLRDLAQQRPDAVAVRFLADDVSTSEAVTYGELDEAARRVAAYLQGHGLGTERIQLNLPTSREYLLAYCGCLYAGCPAVPSLPPRPNRDQVRNASIIDDARPAAVMMQQDSTGGTNISARTGHAQPLRLDVDSMLDATPEDWVDSGAVHRTLAMLQYTSGSSATPKGVMVSHGNLLQNLQMLIAALEPTGETVGMSWLPLHHDMGLIGGLLTPLCAGFPIVLMKPETFLLRPVRWLQAISTFRANWSVAPNFAYQYCVDRISETQKADLALDCWHTAIVGAEPIRRATLEAFIAKFSDAGFARESFFPCYGLAEATLFVSGGRYRVDCAQERSAPLSCGIGAKDETVLIVDPESGRRCAPGQKGEICVSGPNVAQGYWEEPEATAQVFCGHVEGHEGSFLRTGDLGFERDGEIFITGREKNMLIVAGRNIHFEDIEHCVTECIASAAFGRCAAFGIDEGEKEKLIVLVELRKSGRMSAAAMESDMRSSILAQVTKDFEVPVHEIVFVKPGSIPRTSSGKTQHNHCRDSFLAGAYD